MSYQIFTSLSYVTHVTRPCHIFKITCHHLILSTLTSFNRTPQIIMPKYFFNLQSQFTPHHMSHKTLYPHMSHKNVYPHYFFKIIRLNKKIISFLLKTSTSKFNYKNNFQSQIHLICPYTHFRRAFQCIIYLLLLIIIIVTILIINGKSSYSKLYTHHCEQYLVISLLNYCSHFIHN